MFTFIYESLFGCSHTRTTRPLTPVLKCGARKPTYVACLECGAELAYDLETMRQGDPLKVAERHGQPVEVEA